MNSFYSQSLLESLQKIAQEKQEVEKPLDPKEVQAHFSSRTEEFPAAVDDFIRERKAYRKRVASANIGTY